VLDAFSIVNVGAPSRPTAAPGLCPDQPRRRATDRVKILALLPDYDLAPTSEVPGESSHLGC